MSSPSWLADSTGSPLKGSFTTRSVLSNKLMRAATTGSPVVRRLTSRKLVRIPTLSSLGSPSDEVCHERTLGFPSVARMTSVAEQDKGNFDEVDVWFLNSVSTRAHGSLAATSPRTRLVGSEGRCLGLQHCCSGVLEGLRRFSSTGSSIRGTGDTGDSSGTGILVHGCHLLADGWEHIVWGNPPHELGRVPHAVLLAWEEKASVVIFGTGASERDGKKESEVTVEYMYEHWEELSKFDVLKHVPLDDAKKMMRRIAVVDTETQNTDQEVRNGLQVMAQRACTHAILVSSPTHLPRCLACACKVAGAEPELFTGPMYASPSDTCYEGATASDVVVVEPPHRGDRDKELDSLQFHELVKRTFRVKPDRKAEFLQELTSLLEKYDV